MSGFRNVVISSPCKLQYKGGYMVVRREDDTAKIHLSEVSSVVLQSNQVFVSAYLLSELAKAKVTFVVSDEKRDPIGQYLPLYGAHNTSKRIAEQIEWGEPVKKRVWQRIVRDKITHQADVLHARAREEQGGLLRRIVPEVRSGDTTNREGHAARVYFNALFWFGLFSGRRYASQRRPQLWLCHYFVKHQSRDCCAGLSHPDWHLPPQRV